MAKKIGWIMTNRIIGQERIQSLLTSALDKHRLAHAYLFHGQPGTGKDAVALGLAMQLICKQKMPWGCRQCTTCRQILNLEHPAYQFIQPVPSQPKAMKEEKYLEILRERALERIANPYWPVDYHPELTTLPVISINQVRAIKQSVMLKLGGSAYRIFHISQIDKMTAPASNSLLKILEEPPPRTLLILTTSFPGRILATIHSRCQNLHFQGMASETLQSALEDDWKIETQHAQFLSKMAGGSLQRGLQMADKEFDTHRQTAIAFLEASFDDNYIPLLDWVDTNAINNSKADTLEMLALLQALIRDLMQIQLGFEDRVINTHTLPVLRQFMAKHNSFKADIGIAVISQAIDYIEKNAYLPMALFSLSRRLREAGK
ncbi:hypothetical protein KAR48_03530 [bacterium]|nr:hypothetical protein [bacterium]